MATRFSNDKPAQYSMFDRLINDEDDNFQSPKHKFDAQRAESVRNFKTFVRRDLEWLLNSRMPLEPAHGKETERSLYTYGLPDLNSLSLLSDKDQKVLTRAIQSAIGKFEPRIINPRVTLVAAADPKNRSLRFLIEGTLRMEPNPEPIAFDTVLDLSSGQYKVPGDTSAG